MQRIFSELKELPDELTLSKNDFHHLVEVLRAKIDDELEVAIDSGMVGLYKFIFIDKKTARLKLVQQTESNSELPNPVTLICALTKTKAIDEVVTNGTQFGAKKFIFYPSEFSQLKLSSTKITQKVARLEKIAEAAAKQSHRSIVPTIEFVTSFPWQDLQDQKVFLAYEKADDKSHVFKEELAKLKKNEQLFAIFGPEGGFSKREVTEFAEHSFVTISLGKRILRAENAPLYFLSALSFYFEL